MDAATADLLRALVRAQPIAALGTLHATADGAEPCVSMVPLAWWPGTAEALIHVSSLSPHTRDLLAEPRVGLLLAAPRTAGDNPLALARLSLQCRAEPVTPAGATHAQAQAIYGGRFPEALQTFALGDFQFVRLLPRSARFVAGFGRAHGLTAAQLKTLLAG